MPIKTKIQKIADNPFFMLDYLKGINPNQTIPLLIAREVLGEIKTLIDIGCYKGDFTKAGLNLFPNMKVYTFDPLKDVFLIRGNNIKFFNLALSNQKSERRFYINKGDKGWSSLYIPKENTFFSNFGINNYETIKVISCRFDELDIKIERPCFLKIFAQNSDYEILEGFGNRLREVDFVKIEYGFGYMNNTPLSKFIKLLEDYGFDGIIQKGIRYDKNLSNLLHCSFLFFRVNKDKEFEKDKDKMKGNNENEE